MTLWDNIVRYSPVAATPWPVAAAEAGLRVSLGCGIELEILQTSAYSAVLGSTSPRMVFILELQLRWILEFYARWE